MTISNHVTRTLLVAVVTLATVSTFTLDAMKRKRDKGSEYAPFDTWLQNNTPLGKLPPIETWLVCKKFDHKSWPDEYRLLPELTTYIFLLNRQSILDDHVNDIVRNCDTSSSLINAIKQVSKACGQDLSIEIVGMGLKKYGLPVNIDIENLRFYQLCEKGKLYVEVLHTAIKLNYLEVVAVFLAATNKIKEGLAHKLILRADLGGYLWSIYASCETMQIIDQYCPDDK